MLININDIKINSGRREAGPEAIEELAQSMSEVGLLNPITVSQDNTLIAGLHRLEAARLLGWTEIRCNVCGLSGLQAELAEIDENLMRTSFDSIELGEILRRRKEVYEQLHPETIARNLPGHASNTSASSDNLTLEAKPFFQDTADRMGIGRRTVERLVQVATDLTPETKKIVQESDTKITKQNLTKLSRMEPNQQEDAATQLVQGKIKSVDEYAVKSAEEEELSESYYSTGAFIVDTFSENSNALRRVPENHKLRLDNYRKILSPAQIKELICIARSSVAMIQDYIAFLENELEGIK